MKCVICKHGTTLPGFVTVTLERNGCAIILRNVPAEVCDNCGEYYLSEEITNQVLNKADAAIQSGAEVEILRFAA